MINNYKYYLIFVLICIQNACAPNNGNKSSSGVTSTSMQTQNIDTLGISGASITPDACSAVESTVILPKITKPLPVWYDSIKFAYGFYKKTGCTRCDDAIWSSSKPEIAVINSAGVLTPIKPGITTITVRCGSSLTNSFDLAVGNESFSNFRIEPENADMLSNGASLQLHAMVTGKESDESAIDITRKVQWSSSDEKIASIGISGESSGRATSGTGQYLTGTTMITASYSDEANSNRSATTNLLVKQKSTEAIIEGLPSDLPLGAGVTIKAYYYSNTNQRVNCGNRAEDRWQSLSPEVISLQPGKGDDGYPLIIAKKAHTKGTITLDCQGGGHTKTVEITTGASLPIKIENSESTSFHPYLNDVEQFKAIIIDTKQNRFDVTNMVDWKLVDIDANEPLDPTIATVSKNNFSGQGRILLARNRFKEDSEGCNASYFGGCMHMLPSKGNKAILVRLEAKSPYANVTGTIDLRLEPIQSLQIGGPVLGNLSPDVEHILGAHNQFSALAKYTDGTQSNDLRDKVNWSSGRSDLIKFNPASKMFDSINVNPKKEGKITISAQLKLPTLTASSDIYLQHGQLEQCNADASQCFGVANFNAIPVGLALTNDGNIIYVTSYDNQTNYLTKYDLLKNQATVVYSWPRTQAINYNIDTIGAVATSANGLVVRVAIGTSLWVCNPSLAPDSCVPENWSNSGSNNIAALVDNTSGTISGIALGRSATDPYVVVVGGSQQDSCNLVPSYILSSNLTNSTKLGNYTLKKDKVATYQATGIAFDNNTNTLLVATTFCDLNSKVTPQIWHQQASVEQITVTSDGMQQEQVNTFHTPLVGITIAGNGLQGYALDSNGEVWPFDKSHKFKKSFKLDPLKSMLVKDIATDQTGTTVWYLSQKAH